MFEPAAELSGLSLLEFEAGVELRVGRDKGGAVDAIVEQAEPDAPVVYVGDDLTDESGILRSESIAESAFERVDAAWVAADRCGSLAATAGWAAVVFARVGESCESPQ